MNLSVDFAAIALLYLYLCQLVHQTFCFALQVAESAVFVLVAPFGWPQALPEVDEFVFVVEEFVGFAGQLRFVDSLLAVVAV